MIRFRRDVPHHAPRHAPAGCSVWIVAVLLLATAGAYLLDKIGGM